MNTNHADRDKHAGRDENRAKPAVGASDSVEDRLRSHIVSAYTTWLAHIARRLDRLRHVPRTVLGRAVTERGACMVPLPDGDPPTWLFDSGSDRETAARLCAGCPVIDECLELELRVFGEESDGVFGALSEDDRRALHRVWLRRRRRRTPGRGAGVEGGDR